MRNLLWQLPIHSILFMLASSILQAAALEPPKVASPDAPDSSTSIHAVTDVAAGQAGYVHYFLITHPDGTPEDQVGVELEDQRIAWSFPGAGVMVSEFVKNGILNIAGKTFFIEHLHGIRPFSSPSEMQALRNDLARRVAYWVDEETPYCIFRQPGERHCLNCGDFVASILFPATNSLMIGQPAEFTRTLGDKPTTDDLLIYMLGLHKLPDAKSRLERLAALDLPYSLRIDVTAMLQPDHPTLATAPGATTADPALTRKPVSRIAIRRTQSRRL